VRIVSFGPPVGAPHLGGLLPGGREIVDFSLALELSPALTTAQLFDLDGAVLPRVFELWREVGGDGARLEALRARGGVIARAAVRLQSPVPRPGKIICIGLNYRDHALESGMEPPKSPVIFAKFSSCAVGPDDAILLPRSSSRTDYEAELAFVVGRTAARVREQDWREHVLGYVNFNDVSARDFQFADGQWARGKSCDTFAPMGEALVTADEIEDPHRLRIRLRRNGVTLQDSTTEQLIFGVPALLAFLSDSITLEPGDVVATGTPPGVGFARKPPVYLEDGDVVEVEIDGLGVLRNRVARRGEEGAGTRGGAGSGP